MIWHGSRYHVDRMEHLKPLIFWQYAKRFDFLVIDQIITRKSWVWGFNNIEPKFHGNDGSFVIFDGKFFAVIFSIFTVVAYH